jgi:hypothetical protein
VIRLSENQHEKSIGESRFFHIGDFLRQLHIKAKIKAIVEDLMCGWRKINFYFQS